MPELLQPTWIVLLTNYKIYVFTEDITPTQVIEQLEEAEIHWREILLITKIPPPPEEII